MNRKLLLVILPILIWAFKFNECKNLGDSKPKFEIDWVKNISSNFDFSSNWSYPEGVYRNQYGQLSCDGICPIEIDEMKDEHGKIKGNFLKTFYEIIDTTHLFYSIHSETNAPEYTEANFISIKYIDDKEIIIRSKSNISTHSSLNVLIKDSTFSAWIDVKSITPNGNHRFKLKNGTLKVEEESWKKGILKAVFDLKFEDTLFKKKEMFWKGKLLKTINKD